LVRRVGYNVWYIGLDTIGSGFIFQVIQRRKDGSVNFYNPWIMYANGFGNLSTEFWIGKVLNGYKWNLRGKSVCVCDMSS